MLSFCRLFTITFVSTTAPLLKKQIKDKNIVFPQQLPEVIFKVNGLNLGES